MCSWHLMMEYVDMDFPRVCSTPLSPIVSSIYWLGGRNSELGIFNIYTNTIAIVIVHLQHIQLGF